MDRHWYPSVSIQAVLQRLQTINMGETNSLWSSNATNVSTEVLSETISLLFKGIKKESMEGIYAIYWSIQSLNERKEGGKAKNLDTCSATTLSRKRRESSQLRLIAGRSGGGGGGLLLQNDIALRIFQFDLPIGISHFLFTRVKDGEDRTIGK